jgi:hypothetical protein
MCFGLTLAFATSFAPNARADDTERSDGWKTVTTITMVAGVATTTLMPRIFFADPETTAGWKARWHVSVLAPTLANVSLTLLNEDALKSALGSRRPGCTDANQGQGRCQDYGSLSSHAFLSFSALGQGAAVFLTDTLKWSDGQFNVGAFVGNVAFPLVFAGVTSAGRAAGNWETGGTVVVSSAAGLVTGALTGLTYGLLQRPECGYTGSLICW